MGNPKKESKIQNLLSFMSYDQFLQGYYKNDSILGRNTVKQLRQLAFRSIFALGVSSHDLIVYKLQPEYI